MDLLRGSLGVSLRHIRVSGRALLGGRSLFDAVDRSPLFVRPIDRQREATLAQPGQRCARAQAQRYIADGYNVVVDLDLEKFFDRVNHDSLMARVAARVSDKRVLKLIRAFLNAGVMEDGPRNFGRLARRVAVCEPLTRSAPKRDVGRNEAWIEGESPLGFGNRLIRALWRQEKRSGIMSEVIVRINRKSARYQLIGSETIGLGVDASQIVHQCQAP